MLRHRDDEFSPPMLERAEVGTRGSAAGAARLYPAVPRYASILHMWCCKSRANSGVLATLAFFGVAKSS